MPVQAAHFDVVGSPLALAVACTNYAEISDANRDVQHVQPGEAEESAAEQWHAPRIRPRRDAFVKQGDPFRGVNEHESSAADHRKNQIADGFLHVMPMRR